MKHELSKERLEEVANNPERYSEIAVAMARAILAGMEQEPVADVVAWNKAGEERTCDVRLRRFDLEPGPLFSHPAPSIPTVSFYRDGIAAAADWVDKQREAYDNEHGSRDPDTGTFEFSNDAQLEYSSTLTDIADGIRALHPNAASAPLIPATVPEKMTYKEACNFVQINHMATEDRATLAMRTFNHCRAAMLQADHREMIRSQHAEWSQVTFGNVGPVGPLKHLSKEALEAAAEPDDLSEWADMQFLLWDAQRRAGITDEQINQAMIEKLAVNKAREWPEPKDGEPRLHIKSAPKGV